MVLLPGGIDPRLQLNTRFGDWLTTDDFRPGTVPAAIGGMTTIMNIAIRLPGEITEAAFQRCREEAQAYAAAVDYAAAPRPIWATMSTNSCPARVSDLANTGAPGSPAVASSAVAPRLASRREAATPAGVRLSSESEVDGIVCGVPTAGHRGLAGDSEYVVAPNVLWPAHRANATVRSA